MQQIIVKLPQIQLVGIQVRTSYQKELDRSQSNIGPCVQHYFHQALFEKIPYRKKPGTTICAYTDYQDEYRGAYTYFIGEEVSSIDDSLSSELQVLVIPPQRYAKFTTSPGPMPDVIVNAWKEIWALSPQQLGGKRGYLTDFELYDERAAQHDKVVLDLFVGL